MAGGRPPEGEERVERLEGSERAKRRLKACLATLAGKQKVASASSALGISEAAFYKYRARWLQDALGCLEPRPAGRPRAAAAEEPGETESLREEIRRLQRELRASQVREQLALAMPHLVARRRAAEKKTSQPRGRSPQG